MNLRKPFRFKIIEKYLAKNNNLNILDVGCGSHSPTLTKKWRPDCCYTAIDIDFNYGNDNNDLHSIDNFIEMDLTSPELNKIPDAFFDVIIMSHIIEHLKDGDKIIKELISKLSPGGIIYIEFPSERSVKFPSMTETLNFFDDPTHSRIYSLKEVCNTLMNENLTILKANTRRDKVNILLTPVKIILNKVMKGYVRAGAVWDLYGFADFVIAKNKKNK